jgi:hypothetical protein
MAANMIIILSRVKSQLGLLMTYYVLQDYILGQFDP